MGDGVTQLCMDRRLYQRELSKSERAKQDRFLAAVNSTSTAVNSSSCATNTSSKSHPASVSETVATSETEVPKSNQSKPQQPITSSIERFGYLDSILENLTPDDVRVLIRSEDELAQATHFSRIFPTQVGYQLVLGTVLVKML